MLTLVFLLGGVVILFLNVGLLWLPKNKYTFFVGVVLHLNMRHKNT